MKNLFSIKVYNLSKQLKLRSNYKAYPILITTPIMIFIWLPIILVRYYLLSIQGCSRKITKGESWMAEAHKKHELKKQQYQICYIDPGIANEEEMEKLKTIDSKYLARIIDTHLKIFTTSRYHLMNHSIQLFFLALFLTIVLLQHRRLETHIKVIEEPLTIKVGHLKVADFGLAKLALDANSHITTRVMGTFGYVAPEYASSGKLTEKSDVYSYGVVLLELITGRKATDESQSPGDENLNLNIICVIFIRLIYSSKNFYQV